MSAKGRRICREACAAAALFVLVAALFFYFRYLDLKKTLIGSLSERATAAAGQRVEFEDLFLTPYGLYIGGLRIKNPAGFASGDLLRVKRVLVGLDLASLTEGKLHIRTVEVYSPELSIMKDREGRWNISEKLMRLLTEKKKAKFKYRIDRVMIRAGAFEFNRDDRLKSRDIDARITGLSSEKNTRTAVNAEGVFAGNRIEIAGWAYLNDTPKKITIGLTSKGFSLAAFHEVLEHYRVDTGKTRLDFSVTAVGDTEKGFAIRSDIVAKKAALSFLRREEGEIRLMADTFLRLKESRLLVNSATLRAGGGSSVSLQAEIDNILKAPRYRARVLAPKIELSDFRVMKDMMMGGTIASDGIDVRGTIGRGKGVPEISGSAALHNVYVRSGSLDVNEINGKITVSSGRGFSIDADTAADIARAGKFIPTRPARLHLRISASKERGIISFSSSAKGSSLEIETARNHVISAGSATLNAEGRIVNRRLSSRDTVELRDLRYAGRSIPLLSAGSSVDADEHRLTVRDLKMRAGGLTAGAALIQLIPGREGGGYEIKANSLDASYPEEKAAAEGLDFSLVLNRGKTLSGNVLLSARRLLFRGIGIGQVTGKGDFDGKGFRVEVPAAEALGGKMRLAVSGKMSGDLFPLSISAGADNMNLEALSAAVSSLVHSAYAFSGRLVRASFDGTIVSSRDIRGSASLNCSAVSASRNDLKKTLVKDLSADAGITFSGKDVAFGVKAAAGAVAVGISGEVKQFLERERALAVKVDIPEVKAAAARDSFWDIFPDSLLYTGLDGSISSHLEVSEDKGVFRADGEVALKDFTLTGENDEYSLGPVNGIIPVGYRSSAAGKNTLALPPFDRQNFEKLKGIYSQDVGEKEFSRITLGSFRYGFPLMNDITLFVKQKDGVFTIGRLSANIFGGKLNGSAVITPSGGLGYMGGVMIEGLSLKTMCDDIEPIRGYITGRVDGVITFKGSGPGLSGLIGKGDFWTYSSDGEKTRISREFLHKLAGPSLKTYIGNRSFDRGVMSFYLQNGFLVFRQLEISNKNFFGMTDLSVKVAPLSNRISVDQLMWSLAEAAERAKKE